MARAWALQNEHPKKLAQIDVAQDWIENTPLEWKLATLMADHKPTVFALFGIADRDPNECVLMFFDSMTILNEFRQALPGTYHVATVEGVDYDTLKIDTSVVQL